MDDDELNKQISDPRQPFIYSVIVAIALILIGVFGDKLWAKYEANAQSEFVRVDKDIQFAEIYDEFWGLVNDHYYDPDFDGIDWAAQYEAGLSRAEEAKDRADLYNNIIQKQIDLFPVSHLGVYPNMSETDIKEALQNRSDISKLDQGEMLGGLNIIDIKRGNKKYDIVEDVLPNSPAEKAGVKIGWRIEKWRYEYDENQNPIHFYGVFRPEFIEADLSKLNSSAPINIDFPLSAPPSQSEFVIKEIGGKTYIRFDDFMNSDIIDEVRTALKECNPNGIIIDLRKNGGGDLLLLQSAISPLLPRHTLIMRTKTRTKSQTFHSSWFDSQCKTKLAVLIGPNSASAAEIFAQTLGYYKRAILIGRPSNGSVIGAYDYVLKDGTMLQIPTLHILAADGSKIEGVGVMPNINIGPDQINYNRERDIALDEAIDVLSRK